MPSIDSTVHARPDMWYFLRMIDLHQGVTGEELRDVEPGLGAVAMAQLETVGALLRGDVRGMARKQVSTFKLLGQTVLSGVKARLASIRK